MYPVWIEIFGSNIGASGTYSAEENSLGYATLRTAWIYVLWKTPIVLMYERDGLMGRWDCLARSSSLRLPWIKSSWSPRMLQSPPSRLQQNELMYDEDLNWQYIPLWMMRVTEERSYGEWVSPGWRGWKEIKHAFSATLVGRLKLWTLKSPSRRTSLGESRRDRGRSWLEKMSFWHCNVEVLAFEGRLRA